MSERPLRTSPDLVLGTVQLGLAYGIANRSGLPDEDLAEALIRRALAGGVRVFDTARAYGAAEGRLGRALAACPQDRGRSRIVVTKLSPLADLAGDASPAAIGAAVEASVEASCGALGVERLDCLLLHRAAHLDSHDGAVWMAMKALKSTGRAARIGVSVQTPQEAVRALAEPELGHIQIPFNLFDWRWQEARIPEALARRPEVTVHVRSLYLQGLIADADAGLFARVMGPDAPRALAFLKAEVARTGRASPADLALAYGRAQAWVHGLVVGAEALHQLEDTLAAFAGPPLSQDDCARIDATRPRLGEAVLNPALWEAR
ncbi:MAG: aldo/keto reductase [Alphaproteobacteria bacterium]|nr:aldo/keto reductase [Alphaproteobacteria bacterium]